MSPYGIAKLAATQLVTASAAAGQDAVVLRVFNALGPSMLSGTLPSTALRRLVDAVASAASLIGMGPPGAVRDFVDVRDIEAAVVVACRAPRLEEPIVDVDSGTGHSGAEMVQTLAERVGFAGEIGEASAGSPISSDAPWQVVDVSLAARPLGWRAAHDLASTVDLMTAAQMRPRCPSRPLQARARLAVRAVGDGSAKGPTPPGSPFLRQSPGERVH